MIIMITSKGRIPKSVTNEGQTELRRGPWTLEEDNLLIQYIASHGEGCWNFLAKSAGLKRTGKSCRLRWLNYLKPGIRRGNLTPQEQVLILELHSQLGNRWSKIAQHLPGRTDNEIKNYWRTRVQKQARQLKVDSNSKKFLEAIRQFWMPRWKESMEQNSSLESISSSCSISSVSTILETQKTNSPSPVVTNDAPLHSPYSPNPSDTGTDSLVKLMSPEVLTFSCGNSLEGDCYAGSSIHGYCMQELNAQDISVPSCHVVNLDWFGEDFGESFWSNDELWQFKNIA